MSFLKKIFNTQEEPINSYSDFWNWFQQNEKSFYQAVKNNQNVEKNFFNKLSPKLSELRDGYYFLTGMMNDSTAELVLTADGAIKNIAFVEELVNAAPMIEGWKFTALKPAMDIENLYITMADYEFSKDKLHFYYTEDPNFPDEIDITVIHKDLNEKNRDIVTNGTYIFLDNFLGELNFATTIDNINVIGKDKVEKELIPIEKLKDFLIWREKEFVEKYKAIRYDTENDNHSTFEAELENGNKLFAIINTDLKNWDSKASHPWISVLILKFNAENDKGMPNDYDYQLLDKIQDEIMLELKDIDGNLNIGRQTANGEREIYFASRDFRKPSKVFLTIQKEYSRNFEIEYDIYKDKYWQSFNRFVSN